MGLWDDILVDMQFPKEGSKKTPTTFIIFGVTGDLAQKKLFPALLHLYSGGIMPPLFRIVGVSRRDMDDTGFRDFAKKTIFPSSEYDQKIIDEFLSKVSYVQGQFDDNKLYAKLSGHLEKVDETFKSCSNKLFYLSVPPSLYELILTNLSFSGLTIPCKEDWVGKSDSLVGWTRVLIEKPFGENIETARRLDKLLGSLFEEEQIFRIDHYLAKETIQNILTFRFSNTLFEPLWNKDHIQSVEINLLESGLVGRRAPFYDANGALKDVGQNHMLQMLALVAMERPASLHCSDVREMRAATLEQLETFSEESIASCTLRAQYEGYQKEAGVAVGSETETFFSLETRIDNERWQGVPFFLTSGKALAENATEITLHFKDPDPASFLPEQHSAQEHNDLTFCIQPNEGISLLFWTKVPGFEKKIEPKKLSFSYGDSPELQKIPDAYERVLYDCIEGDQTLFTSTREVEAEWKFIMSVLNNWKKVPLSTYPKGTSARVLCGNIEK